ncbi:peptidase domain-containing ABC transporter [Carnobacterium gallinarum]|uniref:peptidase domain-containing ABC transporter n=1 Tax=Carnobacterium gallinarum TaxID=2749 RepID=UPI0005509D72|nr:peptidase domain-containing ABC transporter [Carnobacterium gallinarum]
MRIKGIRQHDRQDCGIACLATIFSYYGLATPFGKIREVAKVDQNGSTIYGLVETAKKYGFEAESLKGDFSQLNDSIKSKELSVPFIAHIIKDHVLEHYVVVQKIDKNRLTIFDPSDTQKKIEYEDFKKLWTGYIVTIQKTENVQKNNTQLNKYSNYFKLVFSNKKYLSIVLMCSLVITVLSIISSFIYKRVIDNYILGNGINNINQSSVFDKKGNQIENIFSNMNSLFIAFFILIIFQVTFVILRSVFVLVISKKIDGELIESYFQKILLLPLSFFNNRDTGDIISRFQDISDIRFLVSGVGIKLIMDFMTSIIGGVILYRISSTLFYLVASILVVYLIVVLSYKQPIQKFNRKVKKEYTKVISLLKETVDGMETIKSLSAEERLTQKFFSRVADFLKDNYKLGILDAFLSSKVLGIETVGILLILWLGSNFVLQGKITLGELISFETLVYFFMNPIKSLIETFPTIQKTVITVERMNDIMESTTEQEQLERNFTDQIDWESLKFCNVSFAYGYRQTIFNSLSFSLIQGKRYAIIGESGNGKTTLVKLLLGFELVSSGEIMVDNVSLDTIPLNEIRKNILYVSQTVFLFNGTIKENLLLGNNDIDTVFFENICFGCEIVDILENMQISLDYIISENGKNLSGGQRQRIALARALLKKPKILILDEAVNQLDKAMAKRILQFIAHQFPAIIFIQIVHDLEFLSDCDYVLSLMREDTGEVNQVKIEQGDNYV